MAADQFIPFYSSLGAYNLSVRIQGDVLAACLHRRPNRPKYQHITETVVYLHFSILASVRNVITVARIILVSPGKEAMEQG